MSDKAGQSDLSELHEYRYLNLTSYRKSGAAVMTTVWFALAGGKVYVQTPGNAGKLKRIRNNPTVTLTPANLTGKPLGGATLFGKARVLSAAESTLAKKALDGRYNLLPRVLRIVNRLRGAGMAYLEIERG